VKVDSLPREPERDSLYALGSAPSERRALQMDYVVTFQAVAILLTN